MRQQKLIWLLAFGLLSCEAIAEPDDDEPAKVYTAADGFNGTYTGTWTGGQSDRNQGILTGQLTLTIANNNLVTGDVAPISGSVRALHGTVNAAGAITASIAAEPNGCVVELSGQVTTTATATTVNAAASGTYVLIQSPTCNTNTGSWTVTRK